MKVLNPLSLLIIVQCICMCSCALSSRWEKVSLICFGYFSSTCVDIYITFTEIFAGGFGSCPSLTGRNHSHLEVWTKDDCTQCTCFEGQVTCTTLSCIPIAPVNSTRYRSVPQPGSCCPRLVYSEVRSESGKCDLNNVIEVDMFSPAWQFFNHFIPHTLVELVN